MSIVRSERRIAAGICGILLGSFGIHKFLIGYRQAGLTMLGITIVGSLLSHIIGVFGYLPWAMGVIGLVEGIIYLVKSDSEFYNTYVAGRRPWL